MIHDPKPAKRPGRTMLAHYATCPCGWTAEAKNRDDAAKRAAEHAVVVVAQDVVLRELQEQCYHPESMEYGPNYPCAKCQLREALHTLEAA